MTLESLSPRAVALGLPLALLVIAAGLAAGCCGSDEDEAGAGAPAATASSGESSSSAKTVLGRVSAGDRDAWVVAGPLGVRLRFTDRADEIVIEPRPARRAVADPTCGLVVYALGGGEKVMDLWAIDLRAEGAKPVLVAKVLPDLAIELLLRPGQSFGSADALGGDPVLRLVAPKGGGPVALGFEAGMLDATDPGEANGLATGVDATEITAAGAKLLALAVKRSALAPPAWVAKAKTTKLPRLSEPIEGCDDEEECGSARPFGATGYQLVVTSFDCGDACHAGEQLYDPAKKRFASASEPQTWSAEPGDETVEGPIAFDASGKRWALRDKVCSVSGCAAVDGEVSGSVRGTFRLR